MLKLFAGRAQCRAGGFGARGAGRQTGRSRPSTDSCAGVADRRTQWTKQYGALSSQPRLYTDIRQELPQPQRKTTRRLNCVNCRRNLPCRTSRQSVVLDNESISLLDFWSHIPVVSASSGLSLHISDRCSRDIEGRAHHVLSNASRTRSNHATQYSNPKLDSRL